MQITSHFVRRALLSAVFAVVLAIPGYAQSADSRKLLDSMIEALGGRAFLDSREIQTSGRFYTFARGDLAGSDVFVDYVKFPDMERTEIGKDKFKSIQINKGGQGWSVVPAQNGRTQEIQPQSASQSEEFLRNFQTSFDYIMRFVANSPRASILNSGTAMVEFKRADVLEIRDASKNLLRVYVDRDTSLPLKSQTRRADDSTLHEETYGNWHKFDGVMTPLLVTRYRDGAKTMEIRTEKVAYDPGMSDSLFEQPSPPSK